MLSRVSFWSFKAKLSSIELWKILLAMIHIKSWKDTHYLSLEHFISIVICQPPLQYISYLMANAGLSVKMTKNIFLFWWKNYKQKKYIGFFCWICKPLLGIIVCVRANPYSTRKQNQQENATRYRYLGSTSCWRSIGYRSRKYRKPICEEYTILMVTAINQLPPKILFVLEVT